MPTIPELVYAALLYPDGNPNSEDFVEGTKAMDSDKLVFSFQRPDETDGLTLEVFAFVKANVEADDGTTNFSINSAPFSKAKSGLAIVGDAINVNETIVLEVNKSSTEKGGVNLKVAVPDGCLLEIDDTAKENFKCEIESDASNIFAITASGISAGVYPVTFTVKKDGEIIYIFTENINVFKILCTDTWGGLAKDIPKEITQDMISNTVYVCGTGEGWYTENGYESISGNDSNSGSFFSPFATIQKAVDTVIARNDFTSNFTIYLDGIVRQNAAPRGDGMADFSALTQDLNLTIKALSGTATLDANQKSRVIHVKPTSGVLTLAMKNLIVKNGCISDEGGGVYFKSTGGSLTMEACEISENKTEGTSYGGGVAVRGGTVNMTDCVVRGNSAGGSGGGIFIARDSEATISGNTEISRNSARNGGGVLCDGTFTMDGGTISGNTCALGKGAYITPVAKLNMRGAVQFIGDNEVYLAKDGTDIATICITGALSAEKVSKIDLQKVVNRQVLSADADVQITQDLCDKFSLIGTRWTIIPNADKTTGVLASLDYIYLKSSSGDDENSGLLNESNAVKTLSKAIELYDKYNSQEISVYAQYTLSIEESDLLNRTNKEHLTLKRYNNVYMFYISQGDVTISNVTLNGRNNSIGATKGLLYISGSTTTVTLDDGAILCNGLGDKGGAVYIDSGHLNMVGGEITGNVANNLGGGVFVNSNGKFTMSGGTISGNYNRSNSSMKASGAIYQNGTLEMSGSASIPAGDEGKNDVYLCNNKTIVVTGALGAESPVATITPYAYTENRPLLTAGNGVILDGSICDQFAVTPQNNDDGTDTEWMVALDGADGTGVLQKVGEGAD